MLKNEPSFIKNYIKLRNPETSDSRSEEFVNLVILGSLPPKAIVDLLKELLLHIQISLSTNNIGPIDFTFSKEIEKTILENIKSNAGFVKQRLSNREILDVYHNNIVVKIRDLINSYLQLINKVFSLDDEQRLAPIQFLINLFYSNRGIRVPGTRDDAEFDAATKTIIAEGFEQKTESEIRALFPNLKEIVEFITSSTVIEKLQDTELLSESLMHVSNSKGPNGESALLSAPSDIKAVSQDAKLLKSLKQFCKKMKITGLEKLIDDIVSEEVPAQVDTLTGKTESEEILYHSKLSIFYEPGGKQRIVAIVDFITQTVLNRLHKDLSLISLNLGEISGHYNQTESFNFLYKYCLNNKFFGTYDLVAATDLLPLNLQKILVSEIGNKIYGLKDLGEDWSKIISTDREFVVQSHSKRGKIRYKIGQPMGAKSSWVVMHLTLIIIMLQA